MANTSYLTFFAHYGHLDTRQQPKKEEERENIFFYKQCKNNTLR